MACSARSSRFLVSLWSSVETKLASARKPWRTLSHDDCCRLSYCKPTYMSTHVPPRGYGMKPDTEYVERAHGDVLFGVDEIQAKLMQEECIIIDRNDKIIGSASKKECHLLENINKGMLHRAFSVFLFNTKGELLLQQRAAEKITFPNHFTNTCCSHPLSFPDELDETGAIGVKRAAQRKLKQELGIEPEQVPLPDFHYLTRILYRAENIPKDNKWGEYEIDYILFIKRDVNVIANPNEVKSYRYVTQSELKEIVDTADSRGILLTPWFKLIIQNFLYQWWSRLDQIESQADRDTIHRLV
ncbi:hypothetical protein BsWGS_04228 [Bradybaena similaris]